MVNALCRGSNWHSSNAGKRFTHARTGASINVAIVVSELKFILVVVPGSTLRKSSFRESRWAQIIWICELNCTILMKWRLERDIYSIISARATTGCIGLNSAHEGKYSRYLLKIDFNRPTVFNHMAILLIRINVDSPALFLQEQKAKEQEQEQWLASQH